MRATDEGVSGGAAIKTDLQLGWMWKQACDLLEQAERMQRQYVRYLGPARDVAVWEPPVDVHETPDGLLFVFALPGVDPDRIEVTLEPGALMVRATRALRLANPAAVIRRMEIPHGRFVRRVALAGRRLRLGESRYLNGCLEVELHKVNDKRASE
ncbi:MAG TPA: Hsp20/alpha crystallin family protein [Steroidobacteraceae bacterium]|nr:Hsp20/alpha crystallin family protein [Steroidobacteraceae bacterium]